MKKIAAAFAVIALAACGSVEDKPEETTQSQKAESVEETSAEESAVEETAVEETVDEDAYTHIRADIPSDWKQVEADDGFAFHFMWTGNDWDDILAQRFVPPYPPFDPDEYIEILTTNLAENEAGSPEITLRETTSIGGYDGFILDADWPDADTLTSLTYLDVDGSVWELTANATDEEGLAAAEKILATSEFSKGGAE